jgi:hypothetical protein
MIELLDHPAIQGGVVPFVAALVVALALARTRFAWLAIVAGYAAMIAVSIGFAFSPLTVARKTVLLGLIAPLLGLALDVIGGSSRFVVRVVVATSALAALWVFLSILKQRDATQAVAAGAGIALFVGVLVAAMLRLRDDGVRAGAAGLGLGLATGVAGVLSASIGYLLSGVAIAASAGAVLLVQVVLSRKLAAGFHGTLAIGLLSGLIGVGTTLLAELPWYALPLLLLIPVTVALPAPERGPLIVRASVIAGYAIVAAALPVLVAWYAARGSLT